MASETEHQHGGHQAGGPGRPVGLLDHIPAAPDGFALRTDLYEIRMAVSYLRRNMRHQATFSLFARRLPPTRGFLVAAGLADCLTLLEGLGFTREDLDYLRDTAGLTDTDVAVLGGLRFTGDVWAVPEGRVVFAGEPLLEVTAPIAEAQLVETALLNLITFQTAVATKAARCRLAAPDTELVDFGARRTQGLETAYSVARCCALAGYAGTSYVAAARRYGLRAVGTMAHSYVEAFPDERTAFRAFAHDFPDNAVFLVDTYDTEAGVRTAVEVARELGLSPDAVGVRLDSGDITSLARYARGQLDDAGLAGARIMASGGLDEYELAALSAKRAPIDMYGVGTKVSVSADAPYLDTAYKLVSYGHRAVMKLSPGKVTSPGAKQVYRGASGTPDLLALRTEPVPSGRRPLLVPVMLGGRRIDVEPLSRATARLVRDLAWLPEGGRRLVDPVALPVATSEALRTLTERVGSPR